MVASDVRRLREGVIPYFTISFLLLAGYGVWGWLLRREDSRQNPRLAHGEIVNGWKRWKFREEVVPAGEWSAWVTSPGNGLAYQFNPDGSGIGSRAEVRFDDGTSATLSADQNVSKRVVAGRILNNAPAAVTVEWFTFLRVQDQPTREQWEAMGGPSQINYLRANAKPTSYITLDPGEHTGWIERHEGVFFVDAPARMRIELEMENGTTETIEGEEWFRKGIKRLRLQNVSGIRTEVKVWNLIPWQ